MGQWSGSLGACLSDGMRFYEDSFHKHKNLLGSCQHRREFRASPHTEEILMGMRLVLTLAALAVSSAQAGLVHSYDFTSGVTDLT